jgi:hypothetical protein
MPINRKSGAGPLDRLHEAHDAITDMLRHLTRLQSAIKRTIDDCHEWHSIPGQLNQLAPKASATKTLVEEGGKRLDRAMANALELNQD